jgi:hypothetical protein
MRDENRTDQKATKQRPSWRHREPKKRNERIAACNGAVEVEKGKVHFSRCSSG